MEYVLKGFSSGFGYLDGNIRYKIFQFIRIESDRVEVSDLEMNKSESFSKKYHNGGTPLRIRARVCSTLLSGSGASYPSSITFLLRHQRIFFSGMLRSYILLSTDKRIVKTVISVTEIASLVPSHFEGRIKVISDPHESDHGYLRGLLGLDSQKSTPILGFDSESKPVAMYSASRNPTAMIQLASENACVLWRTIGSKRRQLPEFVKSVLEDSRIIKVGQGISGDVRCLQEDFDVQSLDANGLIDLYSIGTRLKCQPRSLQGLVAIFLRQRLLKDMQVSDWEADTLRAEQLQYAAVDAWASRAVYLEMLRVYGEEVVNEMGRVNAPETLTKTPSKPFVTPQVISTPSISLFQRSSSPQIDLVKLCVREGYNLKLGEFEKDGLTNRFRCTFHVTTPKGVIIGRSQGSHASIRDAQADAAQHTLAQLVVS